MQERHKNRQQYFKELTETSRRYFIPYIQKHCAIKAGMNVLEIGCGEGGNLLPFAEMGCNVTGVDIAAYRIEEARSFFEMEQMNGEFIAEDILNLKHLEHKFDIIICHDVFEHIDNKKFFLKKLSELVLSPQSVVFMAFPAWQMPFGGHQQICRSKILSRFPFIHLIPASLYRLLLKSFGESDGCICELLDIKRTKVSIESFERLLRQSSFKTGNRQLWFINPHYEIKFGLTPRRLPAMISNIPYLRNFFSTSCWYIVLPKIDEKKDKRFV